MPSQVIVCGSREQESRREAYVQLLGPDHVSTMDVADVRPAESLIVDVRGTTAEKAVIGDWIKSGVFVISDSLPGMDVVSMLKLLQSHHLLLTQPSRYDPRHRVLQQQLDGGQIGDLVALRWVSLWPEDCWLTEGVIADYAFDVLDFALALMGAPKRVMALQQRLKRAQPDTLLVTLVADDGGAIGYVEISCCQPAGRRVERIEVVGRSGMLEYDSDANRTLRLSGESGPVLHDAFWESPEQIMLADYLAAIQDPDRLAQKVNEMTFGLAALDRVNKSVGTGVPS